MTNRVALLAVIAIVASAVCVPVLRARTVPDVPMPISKTEALLLNVPVDVENGARVFAKCAGCHDAGPSALNRIGPVLNGVVGRKAGSVEGYVYSRALRAAGKRGLVWTTYKLDAFLGGPNTFLSGNKMAYMGLEDYQARRDLIAYLKTL